METKKWRGAVAALIALSAGARLHAQAAGGLIQIRPGEPRDSVEMRAVMVMTKARLDSLATLMREFNQIPHGTPEWEAMKLKIDALFPRMPRGSVYFRTEGAPAAFPKGWIGINAQGPKSEIIGSSGYFVQYFDYPSIISVDPDSPAQRAGIAPGDILIGYDGVDVRGHRFDLTQMLVPEKRLSVSVRHEGEAKDYTLTVLPAPAQVFERRLELGRAEVRVDRVSPMPPEMSATRGEAARAMGSGGAGARTGMIISPARTVFFTANGAFGAIMSTVSADLAKTLKLEPGVLVNDVTDETPAARSGLKTGDVIISVAGQPVPSLKALQEVVMTRAGVERSIVLLVMRDKTPKKIIVNW